MLDWWSENGPPAYIAVASYLGLVKKRRSKRSDNLMELFQQFPGGMIH